MMINPKPLNESLGKTFTTIIIVMQNIRFTTSIYRTIITPEKIGSNIEKIDHELPTIYS